MSLNRVTLCGRLTRDPELRTTNNGKSVAGFSIAVDKRRREDGADFFNCNAWQGVAEFVCNYGRKGARVAIDGRLETRKYTDRSGNNREVVEIVVENVQLLDWPDDDQGGSPAPAKSSQTAKPRPAPPASDEYDPFSDDF